MIVALDVPDGRAALALVDQLGDTVFWYKVGMELYYAEGGELLRTLAARGRRIFLDLKLHDIPNTMASALRSLAHFPVDLTTLHIPAGREALALCAETARRIEAESGRRIGLLGVTRLTSLPPADPARPWDEVVDRAGEAVEAGLYGWIAPAPAAPALRSAWGFDPALVCPGIRLPDQAKGDQVAVGTPDGAVAGGADWIVVGRPITRAPDPSAAARRTLELLAGPPGGTGGEPDAPRAG